MNQHLIMLPLSSFFHLEFLNVSSWFHELEFKRVYPPANCIQDFTFFLLVVLDRNSMSTHGLTSGSTANKILAFLFRSFLIELCSIASFLLRKGLYSNDGDFFFLIYVPILNGKGNVLFPIVDQSILGFPLLILISYNVMDNLCANYLHILTACIIS